MTWSVTFYDDETGYAYRVRCKRLTVGDAVQADMLGDEISRREALQGRELLTLSQIYPFVRYATAVSERTVLDDPPTETNENGDPVLPDDANWEVYELTEAEFFTASEWFMLRWQTEAIRKNPHRDPTYEALKKKLVKEKLAPAKEPITNGESGKEKPGETGSSND